MADLQTLSLIDPDPVEPLPEHCLKKLRLLMGICMARVAHPGQRRLRELAEPVDRCR